MGTKNGFFSVRSAYHMEKSLRERDNGECSSVAITKSVWRQIWKLPSPPVLKHFTWKVCHEILPTRVNLFKRRIGQDHLCPVCQREPETICHVLWECPAATAIWQECPKRMQKLSLAARDCLGMVQELMTKLEGENLQLALTVARFIWLRGNRFVFEELFTAPSQVARQAMESCEGFNEATVGSQISVVATSPSHAKWMLPPPGRLKVNWDASVNQQRRCMGMGVVVRDHNGRLKGAYSTVVPEITDPDVAEAMAAWQAAKFCVVQGFQNIIFEGDSLHTVSVLKTLGSCWTRSRQLIEDTRERLCSLGSVEIQHIRRTANQAAHYLAKYALSSNSNLSWSEDCPPLQQIVTDEQVSALS
jgi:ribonuclease HI